MSTHNSTTTQQLNNLINVPVIDKTGTLIETRQLRNTPIADLLCDPNFDVERNILIIDWLALDGNRPTKQELETPIEYEKREYKANLAWGSGVKQGQTIGLSCDWPVLNRMFQKAEDGQRFSRWMLAQGHYGGLKADSLSIKLVKPGVVVPGCGPVEDGFGYIRKSLADEGYNGTPQIAFAQDARHSYTFWQRLDWETIKPEVEFIVRDHLARMSLEIANYHLYDFEGSSFEEKKLWADLDPTMLKHPFVANSIYRAKADLMARWATTVPVKANMRVVVPTTSKVVVPGGRGKFVMYRYPIDSNGSIQAFEMKDGDEVEEARIAKLEVIQHTTATSNFFAKGCLGVIDDALMPEGVDLILCTEDVKMVAGMTVKEYRHKMDRETLQEAVVVFTQMFAAGAAIGVNAEFYHDKMGLDHDGDMVSVMDCNNLPKVYAACRALKPGETPKLPKSSSPLSERTSMILKSMSNLVGFATNVAATTFAVRDRSFLARKLGFKGLGELDNYLNYAIKVGTDGFKTNVDMQAVEKQLGVLQSSLNQLVGMSAPWTRWPNDWAFRRGVPTATIPKVTPEEMKELIRNAAFVPTVFDGTIAEICRVTLPMLEPIIGIPIETQLLSFYKHWAKSVPDVMVEQAKTIQALYNGRVRRVNWSDPERINEFKNWLQDEVAAWMEVSEVTPDVAAAALWRVAHSSGSADASAASVFMAFPDQAKEIITYKPGLKEKKALETIVLGVSHQLPAIGSRTLDLEVEVVEYREVKGNKQIVRRALVAHKPPMPISQKAWLPINAIGVVADDKEQPALGMHHLTLTPTKSGKAWVGRFS